MILVDASQSEDNPTVEFLLTPDGYFFECHSRRIGPFPESERERADFVFKVADQLGIMPKRVLAALIRISRRGTHTVAEIRFIDDHCGDCLLYKTPKCSYAHARGLIFEDDVGCCDFYSLEKRLAYFRRRAAGKKVFERAVESL